MLKLTMKLTIACIAITAVLAACGEAQKTESLDNAPGLTQEVPAPVVPSGPVPAPDGQKGEEILAEAGVKFAFPYAVRYDILDVSKRGTPRHRVLLEVLEGDFPATVEELGNSLAGLGYEKTKSVNKDGRVEQVFVQDGKPAYYLLMQPAGMGPKMARKNSVGSIHIMWNIQK